VHVLKCDVSLQEDVEALVRQIDQLDVLILNAGVLFPNERVEVEGVERTLATNVVNNIQLTDGLLPVLRQSKDARVIFVSSGGGLTESLAKSDADYEQKGLIIL
jgi:dehydrogenase/reductase SDR family protein 12